MYERQEKPKIFYLKERIYEDKNMEQIVVAFCDNNYHAVCDEHHGVGGIKRWNRNANGWR